MTDRHYRGITCQWPSYNSMSKFTSRVKPVHCTKPPSHIVLRSVNCKQNKRLKQHTTQCVLWEV